MGPTCEIVEIAINGATLDAIDAALASIADSRMERTRKGQAWELRVRGRPIFVCVQVPETTIELAAGCNEPGDHTILREIANAVVAVVGGKATEPIK